MALGPLHIHEEGVGTGGEEATKTNSILVDSYPRVLDRAEVRLVCPCPCQRKQWTTYSLFGFSGNDASITPAQVISGEYTSTRIIFVVTAGKATFTLEFFSPVSPKNFVRQSPSFSYLTITASSQDHLPIQVYSTIDSSWTGHFEQNALIRVTQYIWKYFSL